MPYNYRCTREACRKRYSFKRPIEEYARRKTCKCGGHLSHDPAVKIRHKREVCRCDGVHYPHRKGSVPSCAHSDAGPEAAYRYLKEVY